MGCPVATPVRGSAYKLSRRPNSRGLGFASWRDFLCEQSCEVPDLWRFPNVSGCILVWLRAMVRCSNGIVV